MLFCAWLYNLHPLHPEVRNIIITSIPGRPTNHLAAQVEAFDAPPVQPGNVRWQVWNLNTDETGPEVLE
jgi:hypothetical protein